MRKSVDHIVHLNIDLNATKKCSFINSEVYLHIMQTKVPKPSKFLFLTEVFRAIYERLSSIGFINNYSPPLLGDGHPVLLVPGFLVGDRAMEPMHKFLRRINYNTQKWNLGSNMANPADLSALIERAKLIASESQQKISIVGWSLGGVYAREVAKASPDIIRQVITIGSPFREIERDNSAMMIFNFLKDRQDIKWDEKILKNVARPAKVLTTALYSKKDGVLCWQDCKEAEEDELHVNIKVESSHLGMAQNKNVLKILADRLPIA